jgi:hypothetical protein
MFNICGHDDRMSVACLLMICGTLGSSNVFVTARSGQLKSSDI